MFWGSNVKFSKKDVVDMIKHKEFDDTFVEDLSNLENAELIFSLLDDMKTINLFMDNGQYKILRETYSWRTNKNESIKLLDRVIDRNKMTELNYVLGYFGMLGNIKILRDDEIKTRLIMMRDKINECHNILIENYNLPNSKNKYDLIGDGCPYDLAYNKHLHDYYIYNNYSFALLNDDRAVDPKYRYCSRQLEKYIKGLLNKNYLFLGSYKVLKRKKQYIDGNYGFDNEKVNYIIKIINPNVIQIMLCEEDKRPYLFFENSKTNEVAYLAPICSDCEKIVELDSLDPKYCKRNGIDILLGVENDS